VQARGRVDQLRRLGHSADKVEYILMGGTFMSLPADYRDFFVRSLHDALSGHTSSNVAEAVRARRLLAADGENVMLEPARRAIRARRARWLSDAHLLCASDHGDCFVRSLHDAQLGHTPSNVVEAVRVCHFRIA
jgi:hypothetical protein